MRPTFEVRKSAKLLFDNSDLEVVVDGPAGSGKSRAVMEKEYLGAQKYPGSRILFARKNREDLRYSVISLFTDHVLPETYSGPRIDVSRECRLKNKSIIRFDALDRAMAWEWDVICLFEATEFTHEEFEHATIRLRNGAMPYHQIILDCGSGSENTLDQRTDQDRRVFERSLPPRR